MYCLYGLIQFCLGQKKIIRLDLSYCTYCSPGFSRTILSVPILKHTTLNSPPMRRNRYISFVICKDPMSVQRTNPPTNKSANQQIRQPTNNGSRQNLSSPPSSSVRILKAPIPPPRHARRSRQRSHLPIPLGSVQRLTHQQPSPFPRLLRTHAHRSVSS